MKISPTLSRIALALAGLFFLLSAIAKLFPIQAFELSILDQGLAPDKFWAGLLARTVIAAEVLAGICLVRSGPLLRAGRWLSLGMLAVFSLHLAWQLAIEGNSGDCGCMGSWLPMSPLVSLLKNIVLIAWIMFFGRTAGDKKPMKAGLVSIGFGLLFASGILFCPMKSVPKPIMTNTVEGPSAREFAPFQEFSDGKTDLMQGRHIVAAFSLDCEHCQEAGREIGKLQKTSGNKMPAVHAIYWGEKAQIPDFESKAKASFPYLLASTDEFFNLLESAPPRVVLLEKGVILGDWAGEEFAIDSLKAAL